MARRFGGLIEAPQKGLPSRYSFAISAKLQPLPSRSEPETLALFHNIAIIAQSFLGGHNTVRHAGALLLDRRRQLSELTTIGGNKQWIESEFLLAPSSLPLWFCRPSRPPRTTNQRRTRVRRWRKSGSQPGIPTTPTRCSPCSRTISFTRTWPSARSATAALNCASSRPPNLKASPISNSSYCAPISTTATEPSNGFLVVPTRTCSRRERSFLSEASA